MSASSHKAAQIAFRYLCASLGTALFGLVYEQFSHGVWAEPMVYAFLWPLAGGALPFGALALWARTLPNAGARSLWHLGIVTLTVGSLFGGALAIYGTTNRLSALYAVAGGGLCGAALVVQLVRRARGS